MIMRIPSTGMKRAILIAPCIMVALLLCSASAFSADVAHGRQVALKVCSICHVITKGQSEGDPAAPSFRSIAESKRFRDEGAALLLQRHKRMPEFALTREQINDLAAYIKTLGQ